MVHGFEVGLVIAGLGHQHPDLHQGEHHAAEILGPGDAPVAEHARRQQPELLPGEVAAGPGGARPR